MANKVGEFVSAFRELQTAKKNIKRLKPLIRERKAQVARIQFERGTGAQPKTKAAADKMLGIYR